MRKLIFMLTAACLISSAAYAETSSAPLKAVSLPHVKQASTVQYSNISLQFLQKAPIATITPLSENANTYRITLYNVNPYVVYFSDRPQRIRGVAPLAQFVKTWGTGTNSFKENNPNAVIIAAKINGSPNLSQNAIYVSLSSPQYNIGKNTLTYLARSLYQKAFMLKKVRLDYVTMVVTS